MPAPEDLNRNCLQPDQFEKLKEDRIASIYGSFDPLFNPTEEPGVFYRNVGGIGPREETRAQGEWGVRRIDERMVWEGMGGVQEECEKAKAKCGFDLLAEAREWEG